MLQNKLFGVVYEFPQVARLHEQGSDSMLLFKSLPGSLTGQTLTMEQVIKATEMAILKADRETNNIHERCQALRATEDAVTENCVKLEDAGGDHMKRT